MALQIHKLTDTGLVRENNEDSIKTFSFAYQDRSILCLAVADGVGGHQAGDVASSLAVSMLEKKLTNSNSNMPLEQILTEAIVDINSSVYKQSLTNKNYGGMGTTLTVTLIDGKQLLVGHVGDSRAYLVSKNQLKCITSDHSLVGEMVKNGQISREEARKHPRRNIILQAIGLDETVEVDIYKEHFEELDSILLCTDGLSDLVSEIELLDIFNKKECQNEVLTTLRNLAVARGAHDNFSIITAHWAKE